MVYKWYTNQEKHHFLCPILYFFHLFSIQKNLHFSGVHCHLHRRNLISLDLDVQAADSCERPVSGPATAEPRSRGACGRWMSATIISQGFLGENPWKSSTIYGDLTIYRGLFCIIPDDFPKAVTVGLKTPGCGSAPLFNSSENRNGRLEAWNLRVAKLG